MTRNLTNPVHADRPVFIARFFYGSVSRLTWGHIRFKFSILLFLPAIAIPNNYHDG